jgi:hypothetical protein
VDLIDGRRGPGRDHKDRGGAGGDKPGRAKAQFRIPGHACMMLNFFDIRS